MRRVSGASGLKARDKIGEGIYFLLGKLNNPCILLHAWNRRRAGNRDHNRQLRVVGQVPHPVDGHLRRSARLLLGELLDLLNELEVVLELLLLEARERSNGSKLLDVLDVFILASEQLHYLVSVKLEKAW